MQEAFWYMQMMELSRIAAVSQGYLVCPWWSLGAGSIFRIRRLGGRNPRTSGSQHAIELHHARGASVIVGGSIELVSASTLGQNRDHN